MSYTVSTKLHVPQLDAKLVPRPDLMQQLGRALEHQLTLVAAPAGYGKTTSVAMWVRTLGQHDRASSVSDPPRVIKSAWYALDDEDDEFSTFFTRFVTALKAAIPDALPTVPVGLAIQDLPTQRFANLLAEACLALPHETVLVLDDYHVITTPDIHVVLAHLIRYASSRLHLVIASRHNPPLPISRLRAQQQLVELRADDLRLTEIEATALLELRLARSPSSALINALHARTEGWAAGLQLAAAALDQEEEAVFLDNLHRADNLLVLEYLFDEVLALAPEHMRDFMFKTALVARFNVELAARMTGLGSVECREILDQLRQRNLFLVVLDREGTWFRYHRQFRAMLINRAGALLSAQTLDAIRRDAVAWLAAHGWTEEAFAECVAQGYWATAAALVEADRHRLQNRQEWHLLWRRLSQLPDDFVAERTGLLLIKAWILQIHGRYAAIIPLLDRAAGLLATAPPPAPEEDIQALRAEIDTLRAAWFFVEAPVNLRIALAQAALQKLVPATRYQWVRGFAYISLVHLMLASGQRNTAYRQVLQEIDAVDLGNVRYIARLHQPLGGLDYLDGSLTELRQTATHYLQLALQAEMPMAVAWARFGLGWSYFQQGESQPAFDSLLPLFARTQEIHMLTAMLAMPVLVAAAADLGDAEIVDAILEQTQRVAVERENFAAAGEFQAAAAYGALLRRNHQAALAWAGEFARLMREPAAVANLPLQSAQVLIYGKIVLAAGTASHQQEALATLQSYVDIVIGRGYQVEVIQGAVLLACGYWRTGQPVRAMHWMRRSLELGLPRGFRRAFFDLGDDLAVILDAMIRRDVCADDASGLLVEYGAWRAARQGQAPARRTAAPDTVRVLTEREEEILALLAERRSNKEIARQLAIAPQTVRNHTNNIYRKLEVSSRKQAVALARELSLLPPA